MILPQARPLLARWIFVLVKVGQEFLAPFTPEGRQRILEAGGYGDTFPPFLERVLETLAEPAWPAGSYFPGGWFRALAAQGREPGGEAITREALAPFYAEEVVVDATGNWFVGAKAVQGKVLRHFLRSLHFDPALQRYQVRYWLESYYETRYIHHHSAPFRVERVVPGADGVRLGLNDGSEQALAPETLRLDEAENLYCAVKEAGLAAVFEDNARWRLLDQLEESGAGWVLPLGGKKVPLRLDAPLNFPGLPPAR